MAEIKTKKSKMTLDKLALEIERGFKAQDKKFDDKIEKLAQITQQGFLGVENRLDKVEGRLDKVEKDVLYIKSEFKDEIKEVIKEELTGNINKLLTKADTIIAKLEKKEQEDLMHTQAHRRINNTLEEHNKRIKKLETYA